MGTIPIFIAAYFTIAYQPKKSKIDNWIKEIGFLYLYVYIYITLLYYIIFTIQYTVHIHKET